MANQKLPTDKNEKVAAYIDKIARNLTLPKRITRPWIKEHFDYDECRGVASITKVKQISLYKLLSAQPQAIDDLIDQLSTEIRKFAKNHKATKAKLLSSYSNSLQFELAPQYRLMTDEEVEKMIREIVQKLAKEQADFAQYLELRERFEGDNAGS